MTDDYFVREIKLCFSASPVSADIDWKRVSDVIQEIRQDQRDICAAQAEMLAESSRKNLGVSFEERNGAAMACDLLAAIMRRG